MDTQAQNFFFDKKVAVFGAGYVGSQVAAECALGGAAVTVLSRNRNISDLLSSRGVKIVLADIATDSWYDRIGNDFDYCLNCVSSGRGDDASYRQSYVDGMKSLGAWLKQAKVSTITYTSSTSVYSQNNGERVDEFSALRTPADDKRVSSLMEAEQILQAQQSFVQRWVILRLAGIYGPGRHQILDQLLNDDTVLQGNPKQHINLIYRDDITQAIFKTWATPVHIVKNTIFNVVDDGESTRGEMASWLAKRLNIPTRCFDGQINPNRRRLSADRIITNAKIKSFVGWRPLFPSFREGYEAILSKD